MLSLPTPLVIIINNTANGDSALYSNTTGIDNTANGYDALYSNTTGFYNTANGFSALSSNTTGFYNTANGNGALYSNTSGYYNTANGFNALDLNTTGFGNTANGYEALYYNTTGRNNTVLGEYSYPSDGTVSNYTGIGFDVGTDASTSNEVEIGNYSVSVIRGEVNFSTYSDKRIKNTIQQNVPGLAFITKLTPVTYKLDIHKENDMMYAGKTINGKSEKDVDFAGKYDLEKKQMTGFLAQDVEAAAEAVHYDFSGVVKPRNDHDLYSLRYSDFVVPLVKAVQEQQQMIIAKDAREDSMQSEIVNLQSEINQLKTMIVSSANSNQSTLISSASLQQNIPNPFSSATTIGYNLPSNYSSANIIVTDAKGVVLKQINLNAKGKGNVQLDASTLASGAYRYSLYVDGRMVDSKQMIASK